MACDASLLKHYHTPVIHFGTFHFKNEETLYYSAGPISRYSRNGFEDGRENNTLAEGNRK